ncbi:RNase adapter RapZ [Rhodococcus sp. NPDC003348]
MTENAREQLDIDVALVTGLSGAGLSTAAKVLEDMGWYVADNLPPELITRMVDLGLSPTSRIPKLAVVIDVRSRRFTGELATVVKEVAEKATRTRVLFLEASDAVLVRRFEHNRRSHPLQSEGSDGTLIEGIAAERARLAPVRADADLVIDTSSLSAHELRHRVEAAFGGGNAASIAVTVQSFGFKYGLPMDADLVCDVRFLPNPHWIPALREHTGREDSVRDYVLGQEGAQDYLDTYHHVVELTTNGYRREGKRYMTIAVGCTGGKHRSVAMTEALAARLAADTGITVKVVHRDLGRE